MAKRLLARQVSLLHDLTSADAIFGSGDGARGTSGIDPILLRLEARFSHDKRMEKIAAVFPRTFDLLAGDRERLIAAFTASCPPADISRIENARQFHGFLAEHWRNAPPQPPYLPDVAAFELACARARAAGEAPPVPGAAAAGIRRASGVVLLHSVYDLRAIYAQDGSGTGLVKRATRLAIVPAADAAEPLVFELTEEVFDLLGALDRQADPAAFGSSPEVDALIADLAQKGLIEVRR